MEAEAIFKAVLSGVLVAVIGGLFVLVVRTLRYAKDKVVENKEVILNTTSNIASKVGQGASDAFDKISNNDSSIPEKYFQMANDEYENGEVRQGLWIKEMALADQDESKAYSSYIRRRARELRDSQE